MIGVFLWQSVTLINNFINYRGSTSVTYSYTDKQLAPMISLCVRSPLSSINFYNYMKHLTNNPQTAINELNQGYLTAYLYFLRDFLKPENNQGTQGILNYLKQNDETESALGKKPIFFNGSHTWGYQGRGLILLLNTTWTSGYMFYKHTKTYITRQGPCFSVTFPDETYVHNTDSKFFALLNAAATTHMGFGDGNMVYLVVHQPNTVPNIIEDGIPIKNGKVTNIVLEKNEFKNETTEAQKCSEQNKNFALKPLLYTRHSCQELHLQKEVMKHCNCVLPIYQYKEEALTNPDELWCSLYLLSNCVPSAIEKMKAAECCIPKSHISYSLKADEVVLTEATIQNILLLFTGLPNEGNWNMADYFNSLVLHNYLVLQNRGGYETVVGPMIQTAGIYQVFKNQIKFLSEHMAKFENVPILNETMLESKKVIDSHKNEYEEEEKVTQYSPNDKHIESDKYCIDEVVCFGRKVFRYFEEISINDDNDELIETVEIFESVISTWNNLTHLLNGINYVYNNISFIVDGNKIIEEMTTRIDTYKSLVTGIKGLKEEEKHLLFFLSNGLLIQPMDVVRINFMKLNIRFNSLSTRETTFSYKYTYSNLAGDLGGILGLFLGGSMLTLMEMFDIVILGLRRLFSFTRRKNQIKEQPNEEKTTCVYID